MRAIVWLCTVDEQDCAPLSCWRKRGSLFASGRNVSRNFGRLRPACRSDEESPRNTVRGSIPVVASFEDVPAAAPERNNRDLMVSYESRIYFFRSECRLFMQPEH
jgi:hypothetical protein